jgi:hypothetical protein
MPYNASNTPLSTIASRLNRRWNRLRLDHALRLQQQTKKEAERRQAHFVSQWAASADAARALTRRARLTAFHRGTCGREPTPPLSSRTRFLGRGFRRALSAVSCPSPATKSQTGHRAGRAFSRKPPGSGGDEPPPAGTALAPSTGVTRLTSFGEQDSLLVSETGTIVKRSVAISVTSGLRAPARKPFDSRQGGLSEGA